MSPDTKILLIYIEPTPYILGLIKHLRQLCKHINVLFLYENRSQNWDISLSEFCTALPKPKIARLRLLYTLICNKKYNLIHIAGWGELSCILVIILSKIAKIPVTVETDSHLPYKMKLWKRIVKRLIYPQLFQLVNLFLPGGIRQARYLEYYSVKPCHITRVQMTVDVTAIQRYINTLTENDKKRLRFKYQIHENNTVFIYVGRLEFYKGIHNLLLVFCQHKKANITLLVVGDGSLRSEVEEAARRHEAIKYVGRLANNELMDAYFIADALILPSEFEPWGLVVNEAMAAGKPVIVSDRVGCIDDLVTHGETGLIVRAGCLLSLQNGIEFMIQHSDKREIMGRQAINKIANWTLENEALLIWQAWHTLLVVN